MNIQTERKVREHDGKVFYNAIDVDDYQGIGMCIGLSDTEEEAISDLQRQWPADQI
jgi:hypothetical protein